MLFKVTCGSCSKEILITKENVSDFYQSYAWGNSDFKINSSTTEIAIFCEFDSNNTTMLCICGNSVGE